jgi:NADH-quinone oxidoreductase subunit L
MSDLDAALRIVPGLPLAGTLVVAVAGPRYLKERSHIPVVVGLGGALLFSLLLLLEAPPTGFVSYSYDFLSVAAVHLPVVLRADALTCMMLVTVNLIGTLVAVYSSGYMRGDPGYPRYFALLGLFVFCMTMLVSASNLLVLYVFWEGVGLCSYLLIGFWYQRPSAAAAARKAFLVNRIGDMGLMLGLLLLWVAFGSLDLDTILSRAGTADPTTATWICLLLFAGAVGKSAQFPLHVWLPDAMEGPSPVSALIHAATMVTAGVYLVARMMPLFLAAPGVQMVVSGIGAFTALLAAVIALTQHDLKRVLAYSTISQLGLMFLALGAPAGDPDLASGAVAAATFHLFTHAFFKALLFLAAGSVMHGIGDVIDMRRFGGLRRALPWTHAAFLVGGLALAGLLPFAGFWSKDEVLATVRAASQGPYASFYNLLFAIALATSLLTALYTFRAYFLSFWGEERLPEEAQGHAHEAGRVMVLPMAILAIGSAIAGVLFGPTHLFAAYISKTPHYPAHGLEHGPDMTVMLLSSLAAAAGIALAAWLYYFAPTWPAQVRALFGSLYDAAANRFYLDELYRTFIVAPATALATVCRVFDQYILDGLVDLAGWSAVAVGKVFQPSQNGLVQIYALSMAIGLGVVMLFVVLVLRR